MTGRIIIDAQVHIWEPSRPGREWPTGRFVPRWASEALSARQLIAKMDEAGVDRAVLVPPAFEGDRNDLSLDAARTYPDRFAVMGRIPLDASDAPQQVVEWSETPGALGLRATFFMPQQRALIEDGVVDWLWPLAAELSMPLMLYPAPALLPVFLDIARKHPEVRMTIDHMGVGHEDWRRDEKAFSHLQDLLSLAGLPNVAVKASGLPEYSTDPYPYRNLFPYFRRIVDAFGPERTFWGTDLTRLPCTYSQAVTQFTEEMDWLSESDLDLIMGRALAAWHHWKLPETV